MLKFVLRRLLISIPVLVIIVCATFVLNELSPGDAATALAGDEASPEALAALREQLGLDRPWYVRLGEYLAGVAMGDLGTSIYSSATVVQLIGTRLPVTLSLVLLVLALTVVIGVPLGIWTATTKHVWVDKVVTALAVITIAAPGFLVAIFLVTIFAIQLGWLPPSGYVDLTRDPGRWLWHITLPAIALAATPAAELARMTRASMVDVLGADYLRTARAKGLSSRAIYGKHAMKNAALPVVTILGLQATRVVGGAVILEQIFNLPGIGSATISAVLTRDAPVLFGVVIVVSVLTLLVNLITDISYGYFNPSLRAR